MKKNEKRGIKEFSIIVLILLISLFLISFVKSQTSNNKISEEVYDKLEESKTGEVTVILKIKPEEKFFGLSTQNLEETKEDIAKEFEVLRGHKDHVTVNIDQKGLAKLEGKKDVETIFYPPKIKAFLDDTPAIINATNVWSTQISSINISGSGETVCVLDTGINFSHPDLTGKNMTPCFIDCLNRNCGQNCSATDDHGHGTHVAGIIAANNGIKGIAYEANLISVKVLNSNGDGSGNAYYDLANAIDWCVENKDTYNISVITMSLGTTYNFTYYCDSVYPVWRDAIDNATHYNISVIVASGNSGNHTGISSPACIKNSTSVGATTKAENIWSDSNRNNLTDLFAPGASINSTSRNGKYETRSGTSMSAPHISGAFLLIKHFFNLQNNRNPTPKEIENSLNNTGLMINDSGYSNLTFPRIDIFSAIISLDETSPEVNLISPVNNHTNTTLNQSFSCNVSDSISLLNITFFLWNSTRDIFYNETKIISGNFNSTTFNTLVSDYGVYEWNCLAYDSNNNLDMGNSNYTLTITNMSVNLLNPANNLMTNQNTTFNCSGSLSLNEISNVTFYIWNSSQDLVNSSNKDLSGLQNSTSFYYNFTYEGQYEWNCKFTNNISDFAFASANYTVTYDISPPLMTAVSPHFIAMIL